jgi:DNA-binding GntR family transcriptional regulator
MGSTDRSIEMGSNTAILRAYNGILEMIATGQLRPGERTSVIALATRLGFGRTPVKEAITRLETEGLLVVKGRSGTSVADIDARKVRQLFSIRRLLENYAAAEAVKYVSAHDLQDLDRHFAIMQNATRNGKRALSEFIHADVAFHTRLIEAARNPILDRLYSSVKMHLQIVTYLHYHGADDSKIRNREHQLILQMLKKRNRLALQRALRYHSLAVEKEILKALAEAPAAKIL